MVRTVLAEAEPLGTLDGENEQAMPAGRFEQEKETALLNDPVCGTTTIWTLPDWPRDMVKLGGDAVKYAASPGPQFALYATGPDIWFLKPGLPIDCT
jgi:hypothetical protein